ncbi:MAG TPA: hypothetical protein VF771_15575 [Longimicrobiaceae bacterium]
MAKLTLKIDELHVDSFRTGEADARVGTVRGNDTVETEWCTGYPDCGVSKPGCQTPRYTCYGTCGCTENCDTIAPYC